MMSGPSEFVRDLIGELEEESRTTPRWQNSEFPSYDFRDATDVELVASQSTPQSFHLGTGASIFTNVLIPAITSAKSEIILVTCFWSPSKTLSALHDALAALAIRRRQLIRDARGNGTADIPPLRVRICLSSRSILQKLLHPQSRDGYLYPPSSWPRQLGLPDSELMEAAGIDLRVKSLFFLPFSVMHPKFVIIDRHQAFVPSCNVSWESWLEGCLEFTGEAVTGLLSFYTRTWERNADFRQPVTTRGPEMQPLEARHANHAIDSPVHNFVALPTTGETLPTLILPSSHHWNPKFRPWPLREPSPVPRTPLNIALLELFDRARHTIYIQTPNITCGPVITALLDAIQRGVNVTVVTNRNMMVLEQLVTAGTTTDRCVRSLVRQFNSISAMLAGRPRRRGVHLGHGRQRATPRDLEVGSPVFGQLRILSFHPRPEGHPKAEEEPLHSHLKLTIVDDELTVLGSGNMDRASWYTSQELGVLIHDRGFAQSVKLGVDNVLVGRIDLVFDSQVVFR